MSCHWKHQKRGVSKESSDIKWIRYLYFFMCLTCIYFFYMPCVLSFFFTCLHCFTACILITCFRFSCVPSYFNVPLILLSALGFFRILLVFIHLRAFRCFVFSSQMVNNRGNGVLIDFFIFRNF